MGKVLLTSFEPFGLSGRFLRHANAGHDIIEQLKPNLPDSGYDFLRLPVSSAAIDILNGYLNLHKPDAVLCLGEDMGLRPGTINLEPYARNSGRNIIRSEFVSQAFPDQEKSTIGRYHCNGVYRAALQWAKDDGRNVPVGFVHVAVFGNRQTQAQGVQKLLDMLQKPRIKKSRPVTGGSCLTE